ncbi:MAG: hypothetical protein JWL63_2389 [Rhodocyclales bacterium]|nr:hypothetical protein [Rhodocyclales bacterium]
MKIHLLFAALVSGAVALGASAQSSMKGMDMPTAAQSAASMTAGEVRKVDKEAKKITIKHGEIKNLGMPGMTMVFQVKDPAMLDKVKAGDKVQFNAEQINGAITVTAIDLVK